MADNKTEGQDYGFQSEVGSAVTNGAAAGLGKVLGMVKLGNAVVSVGTPLYLSLDTGLQGNGQASDSYYLAHATVQAGEAAGQATGVWVGAKTGAGLGAFGGSPAGQSAAKDILYNIPATYT